MVDTSWMASGSCRLLPSGTMFPSDSAGVVVARRVCAACPVTIPCLHYALANNIEHGVWGGTSSRERRRLVAKRRAAPAGSAQHF